MLSSAVLHGLDLESEHCMFENDNGKVTLVPLGGAQCSVNGVLISEPSQLNQGGTTETRDVTPPGGNLPRPHASLSLCAPGAVILLGRTNMFRFNHPKEAAKLREKRKVRPSVWTPDLLRVRERTTDRTASPSTERPSVFIKPLHDRSVQVL